MTVMESELAACPICGAKILPSVVPMYDDGSAASTASCFNGKCLYRVRREDHGTLARRAEIGRLVEENAAKTTRPISITQDEQGWHVAWDWTRIMRDSLPDALRALADKLKENNR